MREEKREEKNPEYDSDNYDSKPWADNEINWCLQIIGGALLIALAFVFGIAYKDVRQLRNQNKKQEEEQSTKEDQQQDEGGNANIVVVVSETEIIHTAIGGGRVSNELSDHKGS